MEYFKPLHKQMLETVLLRSVSALLDTEIKGDPSFVPVSDIILPQAGRVSRLKLLPYPGGFSISLQLFHAWTDAFLPDRGHPPR